MGVGNQRLPLLLRLGLVPTPSGGPPTGLGATEDKGPGIVRVTQYLKGPRVTQWSLGQQALVDATTKVAWEVQAVLGEVPHDGQRRSVPLVYYTWKRVRKACWTCWSGSKTSRPCVIIGDGSVESKGIAFSTFPPSVCVSRREHSRSPSLGGPLATLASFQKRRARWLPRPPPDLSRSSRYPRGSNDLRLASKLKELSPLPPGTSGPSKKKNIERIVGTAAAIMALGRSMVRPLRTKRV